MRNHRPTTHDTLKLDQQAAEWLHELHSGDAGQHETYVAWLLESPRHVEAFLRVSAIDASLSRIDPAREIEVVRIRHVANESNVTPMAEQLAPFRPRRQTDDAPKPRARMWLLAACLAIVGVASSTLWLTRESQGGQWQHFTTAVGESRIVELEDGSLVRVAANSSVDVRYSIGVREIQLRSGEALFRAQHDPSRPFRVHSGGTLVQAVGTRFQVVRQAGGSVVAVLDGRVRVEAGRTRAASRRDAGTSGSSGVTAVFLDAGDEAYFSENGVIAMRDEADRVRQASLPPKRLVFVNRTLRSIVNEFNLYSRLPEIKVEGVETGARRFAAMTFDSHDPESFLAVLASDPTLEVERRPTEIIIRGR